MIQISESYVSSAHKHVQHVLVKRARVHTNTHTHIHTHDPFVHRKIQFIIPLFSERNIFYGSFTFI